MKLLSTTTVAALACAVLVAQPGFSAPLSQDSVERRQINLSGWDTSALDAANVAYQLYQDTYYPPNPNPTDAAVPTQQPPAPSVPTVPATDSSTMGGNTDTGTTTTGGIATPQIPAMCSTTYPREMQQLATYTVSQIQQFLAGANAAAYPDLKNCVMAATNGGTTTYSPAATSTTPTTPSSGTTSDSSSTTTSSQSSTQSPSADPSGIPTGSCSAGAPSPTTCAKYQNFYTKFCASPHQVRADWLSGPEPRQDPCAAACIVYYTTDQPISGCTVQGM